MVLDIILLFSCYKEDTTDSVVPQMIAQITSVTLLVIVELITEYKCNINNRVLADCQSCSVIICPNL